MIKKSINILAIESSCDDTSAAIIQDGRILSNIVATQAVHKAYGGVVPELASRAHQQHIIPVIVEALNTARMSQDDLTAIAFTQGPGLLGSLLVGTSFAKSFALAKNVPLIAVNHMKAHILAHFIDVPRPKFPFLCLTVSGGHTQLVVVQDFLDMEVVGQTQDDAVGEAFDKTAKLLGLPYPGGPEIDKLAQNGNPKAFQFADLKLEGLDFSFSGIKTSILYFLQKEQQKNPEFIEQNMADICASVQHRLISVLMERLKRAAKQFDIEEIAIAGGVSANSALRQSLAQLGKEQKWNTYIPEFQYCTDNAAMIAMAAHYHYLAGDFANQQVRPMPRMKLA